jgi:Lrp/AsnC family transcriptional regulator for asnA, asnC and gidA
MSEDSTWDRDSTTKSIVQYLEAHPRAPYSEIARALGQTESLVRRRVSRLIEDRSLSFFVAVDQSRFAASSNSLILIDVQHGKLDEVTASLLELPEVHYLGLGTGSPDLIASVIFASDSELGDFIGGKLQKISGIQAVKTLRVLQVLLRRPEWPIVTK